jgi:Family of unknown function (DUF6452)
MQNRRIFIAILSVIFLLESCRDDYSICNPTKDVRFIGGFYQRISGVDVPTPVPSLSLSLLNSSDLIYNNQPNLLEFALPLNQLADSSKYVLSLGNSQPIDTMTIVYYSQSGPADANACGLFFVHTISKIYSTKNTIDSIKIIQPAVNTNALQNAKIYF